MQFLLARLAAWRGHMSPVQRVRHVGAGVQFGRLGGESQVLPDDWNDVECPWMPCDAALELACLDMEFLSNQI